MDDPFFLYRFLTSSSSFSSSLHYSSVSALLKATGEMILVVALFWQNLNRPHLNYYISTVRFTPSLLRGIIRVVLPSTTTFWLFLNTFPKLIGSLEFDWWFPHFCNIYFFVPFFLLSKLLPFMVCWSVFFFVWTKKKEKNSMYIYSYTYIILFIL